MNKKIKKTFVVEVENERYLTALMNELEFKEIERVASGGMMSAPILIMTFEGDEGSYHENDYIKEEAKSDWDVSRFYSLRFPDGRLTNSLEDFKKEHNSLTANFVIERFE